MKLAVAKSYYNISDQAWEKYLSSLGSLIYNTGNSQYSLSVEDITRKLTTDTAIFSTAIGGGTALIFASKIAAKIAGKAAGAMIAKLGAQIFDPVLGLGILIFDVWSYDNMVKESKPALRQNMLDFFNEVKWSILNAPENSIMAAIEDVESNIITALESRSVY
jgi:hypothetical protein